MVLRRTGHILGAASIELQAEGMTIVFSGDLGRYGDPIFHDPSPVSAADYLVVESTMATGNTTGSIRRSRLPKIVSRTVGRGGTVVIPSFAVGRAQSLMFHIQRLKAAGQLRNVPVFLDSPMAVDASEVFCRNVEDHKLPNVMPHVLRGRDLCAQRRRIQGAHRQSDAEDHHLGKRHGHRRPGVAPSQAICPGPEEHHSVRRLSGGGHPRSNDDGGRAIRQDSRRGIPVRAEVDNLSMLSAHADADEIMRWCRRFDKPPRMTFVTHGEPRPAEVLSRAWNRSWDGGARSRHLEAFEPVMTASTPPAPAAASERRVIRSRQSVSVSTHIRKRWCTCGRTAMSAAPRD